MPIEPPDIPTAAPKAAAVKTVIVGFDTTIKPKIIKNKIHGRTIKIEKLWNIFSFNSTSSLLKYGKTRSIIGTNTKTQINGEINQVGSIINPKELEKINISGVTR